MNIVIYTTPKILKHKQGADGYEEYYWHLSNPPKNFKEGERIFFAINKQIVGSFKCNDFNRYSEETIGWNKDTWKDIEPILCKPFQGFKYKKE